MEKSVDLNYSKYSESLPLTKNYAFSEDDAKKFMESKIKKFSHVIQKDWKTLEKSLEFLNFQVELTSFYHDPKVQEKIKDQYEKEGVLSVLLWTSNIIYHQLNHDLESENFSKWDVFLSYLSCGLKEMRFFNGIVYRGVKDFSVKYTVGQRIYWPRMSSFSKSKEIASRFLNENGTLFEVEVISAKDISKFSVFPKEEEVLLMPNTAFEVMNVIFVPNGPLIVKLQEIPDARSENIIFWVDDNPVNNQVIAAKFEKKGFSFIFCISTKQAMDAIARHRWIWSLQKQNLKIITDMTREEDGVMNYEAGICLIEEILKNFKYSFDILIHCQDTQKAEQNLEKKHIKVPGSLTITSNYTYLGDFILKVPSFVVFGVAGKGKSTLLNYLMDGKDSQRFKAGQSVKSVTMEIQEVTAKPYNINQEVTIYDVPGLYTPTIPFKEWRKMVFEKVWFVNAVIWVISAHDRVTCSDIILLKAMRFIFENLAIEKQLILVITHCDSLKENQVKEFADQFIEQLNENYKEEEKIKIIHRINFGLNQIFDEFETILKSLSEEKITIKRKFDAHEIKDITRVLNNKVFDEFEDEIAEAIAPLANPLAGKNDSISEVKGNGECKTCNCRGYSYSSMKTYQNNRRERHLKLYQVVLASLSIGIYWIYTMYFKGKTCQCSHKKKNHVFGVFSKLGEKVNDLKFVPEESKDRV